MYRTFSEQLVSEWFQLQGWLVETGVPLEAKSAGGRDEADILAVKRVNDKLIVQHIEVGTLGNGAKKDLEKVEKKFSKEKQAQILKYVENRLGENAEYECRYIATYVSTKSLELITKKYSINRLYDVIQNQILPSIYDWKKSIVSSRRTSQLPTPPNNLWMIQLINYMGYHKTDLTHYPTK